MVWPAIWSNHYLINDHFNHLILCYLQSQKFFLCTSCNNINHFNLDKTVSQLYLMIHILPFIRSLGSFMKFSNRCSSCTTTASCRMTKYCMTTSASISLYHEYIDRNCNHINHISHSNHCNNINHWNHRNHDISRSSKVVTPHF